MSEGSTFPSPGHDQLACHSPVILNCFEKNQRNALWILWGPTHTGGGGLGASAGVDLQLQPSLGNIRDRREPAAYEGGHSHAWLALRPCLVTRRDQPSSGAPTGPAEAPGKGQLQLLFWN